MPSASCPVIVLAGTSSGVGKTTITIGCMAALRERGLTVQAFKIGPDFIDPLHHEAATGRPSINLDGWMLSQEQVVASFHRHTADADVAVVEGVMGLFDGRDGHTDQGSTAQVAKWLGAPVVLVLDCSAIARSAAAVVKGYQDFDPQLRLGGLIFNKVGGDAHTQWLADAITSAGLNVPVLGGIPKDESVMVSERYLGLHLPGDEGVPRDLSQSLASLCRSHVDLDALLALAGSAEVPPPPPPHPAATPAAACALAGAAAAGPPVRIAVARDAAFSFYYQENLSLLKEAGADLVFFSPLRDTLLPGGISGVYLGGGYPERYASELADNRAMRAAIRAFAKAGGVVYAECGGLLYLSKSMQPQDEAAVPMVGIFPFKTVMSSMTMAYVEVETGDSCPLFPPHVRCKGHVHHHSKIVEEHVVGGVTQSGWGSDKADQRGWSTGYIARPQVPGAPEVAEGFYTRNVLASYVHLHFGSCPAFAASLVDKCCNVDVGAAEAAVADAVAAASMVSFGEVALRSPQMQRLISSGLSPVRSSPNLLGASDRYSSRPRLSIDVHQLEEAAAAGYYGGTASASGQERVLGASRAALDFSQQGMQQRHHSMPYPALSPATTLAKVLSSGSLSNQSTQHPADPHALHGGGEGELVSSLPSTSPSTSPREGDSSHTPTGVAPSSTSTSGGATAAAVGLEQYPSGPYAGSMASGHGLHDGSGGHAGLHHTPYTPPALGPPLTHSHSWSLPSGYGGVLAAAGAGGAGGGPRRSFNGHTSPPHPPHPHRGGHMVPAHVAAAVAAAQQQQQHLHHHHLQQQHPQQQQQPYPSRPRSMSLGSKPSSLSSMDAFHPAAAGPLMQHAHAAVGLPPPHPHVVLPPGAPPPLALSAAAAAAAAAAYAWQPVPSPTPSDKIVALSPGATEMLWALGLGNRVVAVSEGCDYPPGALLRAKALRRYEATSSGGGAGAPIRTLGATSAVTRTSSADSFATAGTLPSGDAVAGQHAQQHEAAACSWYVDEQVLARERPGLIVYEEEEEQLPSSQQQQQQPDGAAQPAAAGLLGSGGSGLDRVGSFAAPPDHGWGSGAAPAADGGRGMGRVGQAVSEALVAVGLQQSCRVLCIRRRDLAEVLESMLLVGEAAGVMQEAVRAVDRLRARLRYAAGQAALAAQLVRRPRVLLLQSVMPIRTVGWWASDLVVLAGGVNAEEQAGDPPKQLTWEQVQAFAPEVLVVASLHPSAPGGGAALGGGGSSDGGGSGDKGCRALVDLSELAARPGWWLLPAVKEGRVFVADHALLCRPGPRLVDGVEALARMVYEDDVELMCPDKAVLKLSLRPGQRCRHRVLPNYFMPFE